VNRSTNSWEPCLDVDTLTSVSVTLVAVLVSQKASANPPWNLTCVTWPEEPLAGPARPGPVR
jgi:hypothetical protein